MVAAAETICAAVARYKELCEGRYKGARFAFGVQRFAGAELSCCTMLCIVCQARIRA